MVSTGIKPSTAVPAQDSELPSSLGAAPELHAKAFGPNGTANAEVSSFGKHAQAICLLDQLLHLINIPEKETEKLPQLLQLDKKLRTFLEQILREGGWVRGLLCGSIATTVRYV